MDLLNISRMIDVSAVRTNVPVSEVERLALAARTYRFICAFVMPCYTSYLAELLKDAPQVKIGGVIGFPSGAVTTPIKLAEAKEQLTNGADELDMVMNIGKFLSGEHDYVRKDIEAVVAVAKPEGVLVKVIQESCLLTLEQVAQACELAVAAGADFVKTSTGFNGDGATAEQVSAMLKACAGRAKVKPSGGIRDWDRAVMFLKMGVGRLGVGSADKILDGAPATDGY